jgi:hypothetical protein
MAALVFGTARTISWGFRTGANELYLGTESVGSTVKEACSTVVHLAFAALNASGDLMTVGSSPQLRMAARHLEVGCGDSFANTYLGLLRIINPHARINRPSPYPYVVSKGRIKSKDTPSSLRFYSNMQQRTLTVLNSYWLTRGLVCIAAPLSAVIQLVAGVVSLFFGLAFAALSVATLGLSTRINSWAYDRLKTPGWMINQLHMGILGFFRPDLA